MKSGEKELKKGQTVTVRSTRLSRNPEGLLCGVQRADTSLLRSYLEGL